MEAETDCTWIKIYAMCARKTGGFASAAMFGARGMPYPVDPALVAQAQERIKDITKRRGQQWVIDSLRPLGIEATFSTVEAI